MANPWFRVWTDMINDPKWRTIARKSGQRIGDVVAVYVHMMTMASNATERGRTEGWCDEDVATALDIDAEDVAAIREAMQGRVLDGDYLTGWEKRQPMREDNAAERAKAWREAQKLKEQTQPNATERNQSLDKIRGDKIREEQKSEDLPAAKDVIDHLNAKSGSAFRHVDSNLKLILARLKEGATVDECKQVIDRKCLEWLQDVKMHEYLRPATLFNATNFASYVGQLSKSQVPPPKPINPNFLGVK